MFKHDELSPTEPSYPATIASGATAAGAILEIAIPYPAVQAPADTDCWRMGSSRSPTGDEITVDSCSLMRNGVRWLPVMGEFHYARYPQEEWRQALLQMRACGVEIVATYIFWIHHEESEGSWDWDGRRDLRAFVQQCHDVGLLVAARIGPWCHGEARNGGLPDWLHHKQIPLRTNDSRYLLHVSHFYEQIGAQLRGLLWRDGGPVVSVQIENEYSGSAQHLLNLKQLAVEAGLDVPLYTRTGWPALSDPMPHGALLPLYGGYPDGFWDRSLNEMPRGYQEAYQFTLTRADMAIATDQLGERIQLEQDERDPYFACEIGGGMQTSYHRRINIAPKDIEALALVKIGSGNNLQGYYMFHGGANPDGRLSTLQESQQTGYWNDLPVKSYDFQAPIGEYGQVRDHFHRLRRLHLFLGEFGSRLCAMSTTLPESAATGTRPNSPVRWSVRSEGTSGFLFVNNYQRLHKMERTAPVQFQLRLAHGDLNIPAEPVTIPADKSFVWPFHMEIAGAKLIYATAQPVCQIQEGDTHYAVFAETAGVAPEFVFDSDSASVETASGRVVERGSQLHLCAMPTGTGAAARLRTKTGAQLCMILLDEQQSYSCWKQVVSGKEALLLTQAALTVDRDRITLRSGSAQDLAFRVLPQPEKVCGEGSAIAGHTDGLFTAYHLPCPVEAPALIQAIKIQEAGPARPVSLGNEGVAEAPGDSDFADAAKWRLVLPSAGDPDNHILLRFHYVGDVARVYAGDTLLTDNFYNGKPFEIGLWRHRREIDAYGLRLEILPLRQDAPIYLSQDASPEFTGHQSVVSLLNIEVIQEHTADVRMSYTCQQIT